MKSAFGLKTTTKSWFYSLSILLPCNQHFVPKWPQNQHYDNGEKLSITWRDWTIEGVVLKENAVFMAILEYKFSNQDLVVDLRGTLELDVNFALSPT